MSWNSIPGFTPDSARAIQEAAGITQFPAESQWYQIINGLYIQGGKVTIGAGATLIVPLVISVPTQILGVFTQGLVAGVGNGYVNIDPAGSDLEQFTAVNTGAAKDFYWWAIGV